VEHPPFFFPSSFGIIKYNRVLSVFSIVESYDVSPGVEGYAITGFFYKVRDSILQTTQCCQAIYTREPDNRPEWFSFPLELQVSH
jgi:hypothetical protein